MLKEFERMLRDFGGREYDATTDTYRQRRGKKLHPVAGARVREAAALAEEAPTRWAEFFGDALKQGV